MHLPTPIPKPARPNATAKAIIRLDEPDTAVKLYLFTDIAPVSKQGLVYPRFAWTAGDLTCPPAPGKSRGGDQHFSGRATLVAEVRATLEAGGWPAQFGSGLVSVTANPGHGTGEADVWFDGPETLLAAVEDAFAEAGWVLVGTAKAGVLPGFFRPGGEEEGEPSDGELSDLLRQLAQAITDTLG
jgi:hypothetical protein